MRTINDETNPFINVLLTWMTLEKPDLILKIGYLQVWCDEDINTVDESIEKEYPGIKKRFLIAALSKSLTTWFCKFMKD